MGYLYCRVLDAEFIADTPERRAFKRHLEQVAEALKAIEWVDSGDWGPGDENEAILDCVKPKARGFGLSILKQMRDDMSEIIARYE